MSMLKKVIPRPVESQKSFKALCAMHGVVAARQLTLIRRELSAVLTWKVITGCGRVLGAEADSASVCSTRVTLVKGRVTLE